MRPRHALAIARRVRIVHPPLARPSPRRARSGATRAWRSRACRRRRAASSRTRSGAARRAPSPSRDAGRARRCGRSTHARGCATLLRSICASDEKRMPAGVVAVAAPLGVARRAPARAWSVRARRQEGEREAKVQIPRLARRAGDGAAACARHDRCHPERSRGSALPRLATLARDDDTDAAWVHGAIPTPYEGAVKSACRSRGASASSGPAGPRPRVRRTRWRLTPDRTCPSSRSTPAPRAPAPWSSPTMAPCSRRRRSRSPSTSPPTDGWSTTPTRSTRRRWRARARRSPRRSSTRSRSPASASRCSARRWSSGTARRAGRCSARSSGRTGARRSGAASWREDPNAVELVGRTGLLLDPYFSATKLAWILDHVDGARAAAERGELIAGTIDTWLLWKLTGGKVHATDATNASRTLLFDIYRQQWDEELCVLFDVPMSHPAAGARQRRRFRVDDADVFGAPITVRSLVGDQQAGAVGQDCVNPGEAKATYGTGCFVLVHTGDAARVSRHRLLGTVALRLAGRDVVRARGEHLQRGHGGAVAARPARPDRARARERVRRGEHSVVRRRVLHPRVHRARRTVVGSRRARRADRPHARQRPRAHRARRARVGRVPDARSRERVRRGRRAARGAARGRRHGGERVADAGASPISSASPSSGPSCSRPRRGARRGSPECTPAIYPALGEKGVRRVEQTFTANASKHESDAQHAGWLRAIHRVRS